MSGRFGPPMPRRAKRTEDGLCTLERLCAAAIGPPPVLPASPRPASGPPPRPAGPAATVTGPAAQRLVRLPIAHLAP
jgi:hypothetical protein